MKERFRQNPVAERRTAIDGRESFYVRETKYKVQSYYTVKDVANMMNVTEKHVRNMINRGDIAAKRFGGSIRIPYSELVKNIKDY